MLSEIFIQISPSDVAPRANSTNLTLDTDASSSLISDRLLETIRSIPTWFLVIVDGSYICYTRSYESVPTIQLQILDAKYLVPRFSRSVNKSFSCQDLSYKRVNQGSSFVLYVI